MDPADLFADVLRARVLQKVHTRLACDDPGAQPDDSCLGFDFARALTKMRTMRASFPRMLLCADLIVQLV